MYSPLSLQLVVVVEKGFDDGRKDFADLFFKII